MRWKVVLLLGAAFSFHQVVAKVPSKESLCGMIVDAKVEQECLSCFIKAGHISEHPEEVRNCTATYLPPDLAKCSVPHSEKPGMKVRQKPMIIEAFHGGCFPTLDVDYFPMLLLFMGSVRIHQGGGDYHHNHTNANYLPTCLKRRLKKLQEYQGKEEMFVTQASLGVKYIVESKLIKNGGPTMLNILAMNTILDHLNNRSVVEESVSYCQSKFSRSKLQYWERDLWEETDELLLEDLMKEEEEEMEEEDAVADEMEEDSGIIKRSMRVPGGDKLPFGGTNILSKMVMLQECIVTSLLEHGAGPDILNYVMREKFYDPVPASLVEPLLSIAQSATGQNN